MKLICYSSVIFSRNGFPRDSEGKPFLPKNVFIEAFQSALVFYYIKKDREIENRVRKYLTAGKLDIKEIPKKIQKIVNQKYPFITSLEMPEAIPLPEENIKKEYIEIFDLKEWIDVKGFKTEVFSGVVEIPLKTPYLEKLKAAAHSYAEALAKIENSFLKEHSLSRIFYQPLINELKKWEIPLRVGMWTESSFRGNLLFFWKIKEIREKIMKELKIDIRPRYILYIPKLKQTTGWSYLKT